MALVSTEHSIKTPKIKVKSTNIITELGYEAEVQ